MIDEQSSASGHDYASDRSAIEAGVSLVDTRILNMAIMIIRLIIMYSCLSELSYISLMVAIF